MAYKMWPEGGRWIVTRGFLRASFPSLRAAVIAIELAEELHAA